LEAALTLQPDTRHVVVIGGSLPFDQARIAQARRQFESYQSRLEFTYVSDLSMADLLRRVHELPSHSIVLVLHLFRDGAGQEFRPYDSFQMIARASNVPVYGVLDSYMGAGMVGGQVASFPAQGRVAGELAARVLAGESPDRLGIRAEGTHLVYDWTQLRRWGLGERRVPPDAVVRFREPGIWEQYGWYIAAAMVICSLQAGLIAALLFQRSARHEAQRSLQDRVRFLGLVIELSASSLRLTAAEVDRWIADWLRRLGVFLGVDRAAVIVEQMGALRATHTWSTASIGPLPPTAVGDVPWAASALRRGEIVQVSRLPELPPAAATDRATWQRFGVKSFLATPLTKRGSTISALSFATHRGERTWPDELVTHLRLIGHIFASAFAMRRAEIARYASEQLSGTLLGVLSAPSAVVDRQSNILRVNQAWRQLAREAGPTALPWGPVGSNYLEICRRAGTAGVTTTPEALSGIEAALSGGNGEFRLKYDWASSTGRRRMEVLVAPLTRPEGGAVISHIDLTDRERAERETQELRQTIAHFGRVASLGELSASLAHELNQPLTAILSNVQAARRFLAAAPDNLGEIHEILTDIEEDDRRAGEVIRRLRTMIRKGQTEHQVFYLHDQVREVTHLIAPDTRIRQIPVVLELDSALPPVRADQIQLSQVILNLMMNGADAMEKINPGERELLLRTWRYDDASVALSVRDRGVGISVSPVDRIFEPFYTSKRDGMGMGLSICRSILEAHGGRIWASNNPDRGATLHLVLPISREEAR
jgi:C4-dicarboxylate-specific signal transduction histidine kinase